MKLCLKMLFLLFSLPLVCAAAETNSAALVQANQLDLVANPSEMGDWIDKCHDAESDNNTRASVGVSREMHSDTFEYWKRILDGNYRSVRTDRGYPEAFASAVLVIIDPSNKKPISRPAFKEYANNLCTLALGNEANIFVIDLAKFSNADKKRVREFLLQRLGGQISGQTSYKSEKLDLENLLTERQVNIIALLETSATNTEYSIESKPQTLLPIHSLDARWDKLVGERVNQAYATLQEWRKNRVPTKEPPAVEKQK